jgi:hypothetical protein
MISRFAIGIIFSGIAFCSTARAETTVYQCAFNKAVSEKSGEKDIAEPTKMTFVYDSEKPNALAINGRDTASVSYHRWGDTITFFETPHVATVLSWYITVTSIDADGRSAQSNHVMNVDKVISDFWQIYGQCSKSHSVN